MTAFFGAAEGAAEAWGEGAAAGEGAEVARGTLHLGHGHSLQLNPAAWQALLHHPDVAAQVQARAQQIADAANEMAVTRESRNTPVYEAKEVGGNTRPRWIVKPGNLEAVFDNAAEQTLMKAMDSVPTSTKAQAEMGGDITSPGNVTAAEEGPQTT